MKYPAYFYADAEGKEPVYEYITRLPLGVRAKTYALISYLQDHGPAARRPQVDYLGPDTKLYELRPVPHRILYCYVDGGRIILLHAFRKSTDRVPQSEIRIALDRKADYLRRTT